MIATIITTISIVGLSWLAYKQTQVNKSTGDVFLSLRGYLHHLEDRIDNQEAVIQAQQKMIEELQKPTSAAE